ncbi:hypothetical protein IV203_017210 [Nitzschia inconspicua]|uniref:Photosystem II reaction center X protein n=1 Tax=Nitzschia inconspicua TaxID=303405 RepID=A0A9K3PIH9_9STRA|nr:hypothetical protein IV203_017210 [Nitzschia inconspicua]
MTERRFVSFFMVLMAVCTICGCDAFCASRLTVSSVSLGDSSYGRSKVQLQMEPVSLYSLSETSVPSATTSLSSSLVVSAATLDPTTILSDIFAGILGTPLILAVPIVAALGVASLIAFLIVSYASPQVEDDE